MKRTIIILTAILLIVFLIVTTGFASENQKLAQTGFQFLSVVSDARAAAMAEAMTSLQIGSGALFFNPAGMANMNHFIDLTASSNKWIADINHNTFSMAINPAKGKYGVFGFSLQVVDYGEFYGTRVDEVLDWVDTEVFELSALAIGTGYAKQLTDRFSVGGQVRWVKQDLGKSEIPIISISDTTQSTVNNRLSPLVFDFGTQFRTGFKSLVFGMSVRNFSKEIKYVEEGFQLPLVFNLGISINLFDFWESALPNQSLYLSIDASHYRDYPEQVKFGVDYRVMKILSVRGGYRNCKERNGFSFGIGVSYFGLSVDYSYTPFGVFDKVQRMTARFTL